MLLGGEIILMKKMSGFFAALLLAAMSFTASAADWCEDFEDNVCAFDAGGGPSYSITANPDAAVGGSVLKYTQGSGKSAAWIRTKEVIVPAKSTGVYKVGVDLYIPETSFTAEGQTLEVSLNTAYNHKVILVSEAVSNPTGFNTNSYPKDEWFRLVFELNFDAETYDVYVEQDGKNIYKHFTGRKMLIGNDNLKTAGVQHMRLYLGGAGQLVYVDNIGIKPETEVEPASFGICDFEEGWGTGFVFGGSASRSIAKDPVVTNNRNVLKYEHTASQSASWMKNKADPGLGGYKTGVYEIGADLYIPEDALTASGSNIRFDINDANTSHFVYLDPAGAEVKSGRTSDFPRNCWFRLRFVIDLDKGTYDAEIVRNGKVINRIWDDRGASSLKTDGLNNFRLFMGEPGQTIYVENFGISKYTGDTEVSFFGTTPFAVINMPTYTEDEEEYCQLGLFAGIDSYDYNSLGFMIEIEGEADATDIGDITTVYNSIRVAGENADVTVTADDVEAFRIFGTVVPLLKEKYDGKKVWFTPYAEKINEDIVYGQSYLVPDIYTK